MRNHKCILSLILIMSSFLSSQEKTNIAVIELKAVSISESEATLLTFRLRMSLFETDRFVVVEREAMTDILKEQGVQMSGNVIEWCSDWYTEKYYHQSPAENPQGPDSGVLKSYRGGSFVNALSRIRSTHRGRTDPSFTGFSIRFRVVKDL